MSNCSQPATRTVTTPPEAVGQRLDRWLAEQLPEQSRSAIQRWIKAGAIRVDGALVKAGQALEAQQQITLTIPQVTDVPSLTAEAIPLKILYEDDNLLIVDKEAGMVVHPAPGHESGTLVHAILHHCPELEGVGGERRPGIVHRLDKETSGLLVVAKNDRAHRDLQTQFKARTVYKEYLALVEGTIEPATGRINAPIGRHPVERKRQAVLPPDPQSGKTQGRTALTDYYREAVYVTAAGGDHPVARFSLVRVVLHTGRTHQIRVHFAWYKHPIVGDTLYGYRRQRLPLARHFLHAHKLRLRLPDTREEREFVAPLPADLASLLATLHSTEK
ncbi:MAG: RluA family pseudouridine synthase [Caldilineaceae bacterium]|nr:RluA family pseudouridine synthase [Caldilineaceae bacterium]MCB0120647.1 RluA family pseudouridine synthase [Caldilineaceae bacterium]